MIEYKFDLAEMFEFNVNPRLLRISEGFYSNIPRNSIPKIFYAVNQELRYCLFFWQNQKN
jgi:hypothetical protein